MFCEIFRIFSGDFRVTPLLWKYFIHHNDCIEDMEDAFPKLIRNLNHPIQDAFDRKTHVKGNKLVFAACDCQLVHPAARSERLNKRVLFGRESGA